jgi:hypothetical protein
MDDVGLHGAAKTTHQGPLAKVAPPSHLNQVNRYPCAGQGSQERVIVLALGDNGRDTNLVSHSAVAGGEETHDSLKTADRGGRNEVQNVQVA